MIQLGKFTLGNTTEFMQQTIFGYQPLEQGDLRRRCHPMANARPSPKVTLTAPSASADFERRHRPHGARLHHTHARSALLPLRATRILRPRGPTTHCILIHRTTQFGLPRATSPLSWRAHGPPSAPTLSLSAAPTAPFRPKRVRRSALRHITLPIRQLPRDCVRAVLLRLTGPHWRTNLPLPRIYSWHCRNVDPRLSGCIRCRVPAMAPVTHRNQEVSVHDQGLYT